MQKRTLLKWRTTAAEWWNSTVEITRKEEPSQGSGPGEGGGVNSVTLFHDRARNIEDSRGQLLLTWTNWLVSHLLFQLRFSPWILQPLRLVFFFSPQCFSSSTYPSILMSAVIRDIYIYPPCSPPLLMVIHHCDVWLIGCCHSISPNLQVPHDFYLFILHHLWRNPYRSCNVLSSASTVVYWGRPLPLLILIGTSVSSQYQQRVFLYVVDAMLIRSVLPEVPFSMT